MRIRSEKIIIYIGSIIYYYGKNYNLYLDSNYFYLIIGIKATIINLKLTKDTN